MSSRNSISSREGKVLGSSISMRRRRIESKQLIKGFLGIRRRRSSSRRRVRKKQRRERIARRNRLHMVLNKIDNVIIKFPHMSKLRNQHRVIPPQPLIILRQSRHRTHHAVTRVTIIANICTAQNREASGCSPGWQWWRVTPIDMLVRI